MSEALDDLEAVRTLADTLKKFDTTDQERIIRWAREKLKLPIDAQTTSTEQSRSQEGKAPTDSSKQDQPPKGINIKTFVEEKKTTKR